MKRKNISINRISSRSRSTLAVIVRRLVLRLVSTFHDFLGARLVLFCCWLAVEKETNSFNAVFDLIPGIDRKQNQNLEFIDL